MSGVEYMNVMILFACKHVQYAHDTRMCENCRNHQFDR
jgi:hypothetical protein